MKDCIGNRITEKSLLCWHPEPERLKRGLIVQAVRVEDGGLSMGSSKDLTPAMLIIQIVIPIDMGGELGRNEPTLGEMLCVVNPQQEALLEGMMKGKLTQ